MADPLHQFQIVPLVDFGQVTLPVFGVQQLAFTNSHLAMTLAFLVVVAFLQLATAGATIVPGRRQAVGETLFGMIDGVTSSIIGHEGKKFFPFVFTIFTLILAMNLLGMFLTFTATSQLAVTATFALITILMVIGIGIVRHGLGFFLLFWPTSAPLAIRPVVGLIEFLSFLLRPITLALRLFGNMLGGHIALKIFAGFVVSMGAVALAGGIGLLGLPVAALSLGMVVALTALEFLVAFLQAFVFAVLTSIYLNDVVNLGHGH
ncbi:ATP synthase subunit a [Brevundimonas subvibrioides]|uniref:ATP synthase subunit a n=1 Tax=Brevundimonas subvibrioides (strain ATCC 15264 / DSM 4735 / LMG 14903 / NBRC 16000 / CB 81) TaxID=633149 RepID=D9QM86_BRESC|nr:F0F1 ATP synthase subunit A [Brevundimonas subvibrioides]ADL02012.1 ATP synthase F0, A subunit [Brevundimonas subvibrioides ATCC 15264]